MNDNKTWGAITLIIVVVSGFLLFTTFKSKETEKRLRIQKEQELSQTQINLAQVQADLVQIKKERGEAEEKFQANLSSLQTSVEEYKKSAEMTGAKIAAMTKEKEFLVKNMNNNTLLISRLNKKIEKLEDEKINLLEKIKRFELEKPEPLSADETPGGKGDVQAKLVPSDIVDLGKIIIHKSSNQAAIVEHVNTLYGFVVISAGEADGLRKDAAVNITRNDRFIAKAIVKKVRQNVSSAVTLPEWTREEIKIGDLVSISDTSAAKNTVRS